MSHVSVSRLAYAHPGGDLLFSDVSLRLAPGAHAGLVGANGVGKSTLLKVLTGVLTPDEGEVAVGGRLAYMAQDIGVDDQAGTVRELLLDLAPAADPSSRSSETALLRRASLSPLSRPSGASTCCSRCRPGRLPGRPATRRASS